MASTALLALALALAAPRAHAQDLTSLVNLFIGTGASGNAFPGAAIPHAMAKVGIDVDTQPRQAGYVHDNSSVVGISLMHDEGTGGNAAGGYGVFPLFPLAAGACSFADCPVSIADREAKRAADADLAKPGWFSTTFVNGIQIEATSTRRAGLIRFTFPESANGSANHIIVDMAHDLQRSFQGNGALSLDKSTGRVEVFGTYLQSYGLNNYTAYGCYDFVPPSTSPLSGTQALDPGLSGVFSSPSSTSASTPVTFSLNDTSVSYPFVGATLQTQAGAIVAVNGSSVVVRFGVSMVSTAQACSNAEEEVPSWDWDGVQGASAALWEDILERITIDPSKENQEVVSMLYSSLYRSHLVPANLTGENPYWDSPTGFWDAFFCSWDTFRTVHPLLSILSPRQWSEIVNAYIDGWRHTGFIPECRSNTKAGFVQGGSDGMPILGDFAIKYGAHAADLGVPSDDLYQALVDTAENTPSDWYTVGRQNTAWKQFGYIPTDWVDPSGATGLPTREASRALEYAVGDFGVRQAAKALGKSSDDVAKYENRSMNFVNHWSPNTTSDGFTGFMQRRFPNGTFDPSPPDACSPVDPVSHSCVRGTDNNVGFYESSSWEYSFFAPHSMSSMVELMGGAETFISRLDHYFSKGYFSAGNEPGFETPWLYHYADRPDLSALRVRDVVFNNFNDGVNGIPGNDDSGAMAALLVFHILGLYPVPASTQLLIGSPLVSAYKLKNDFFGTTTSVSVQGFDAAGVAAAPPAGASVYVKGVTVDGQATESLCWIEWSDVVSGKSIVIEVDADADAAAARGCGGSLPDSLATGGFA